MQTEPLLIHLPLGIAAAKVASLDSAPNFGSGGFDVHLGLELAQPDASREEGPPLASADTPVAWAAAVLPSVPLTSLPAWPADQPSDGTTPIEAMPVEVPADAGFEGMACPQPPLAAGDRAKASLPDEGSIDPIPDRSIPIGPIPIGPIKVGPIKVGPIPDGSIEKLAPFGDDLRTSLTSFPQADASRGASPPREGGSLAGGPPLDRVSQKARSPSAAGSMPFVLHDGSGPGASLALAGPMPNGSAGDPKAGSLPGPVAMNAPTAPRPVPPAGSVGEPKDPRQNADLALAKASTLTADPEPVAEVAWPAVSNTTDKPSLPTGPPVRKAETPEPVARATRAAAMLVSELGTDPQPVQDPVKGGSDPSVPAKDRAAPASQVRVSGAERLWLGTQHMQAEPTGVSAGTDDEIGLSGKVAMDASVASPDRARVSPAVAGTGAATAPQLASSRAVLAFRQAEDPLFSSDPTLGIADRLPVPPPSLAASTLPPAAPVLQAAAQIVASLTQRPDGTTEIALSPEELGSVRLQFQADAQNPDRMVVHLAFDRPETMDLFRRHADLLTEAIRSAGYSEARLDFGQAGAGSGDGARPGQAGRNDAGADPPLTSAGEQTATDAEPDRSYALRLSGVAGMDLRL